MFLNLQSLFNGGGVPLPAAPRPQADPPGNAPREEKNMPEDPQHSAAPLSQGSGTEETAVPRSLPPAAPSAEHIGDVLKKLLNCSEKNAVSAEKIITFLESRNSAPRHVYK